MKVVMRTTVRIAPGKMAEYMEVEEKSKVMASRYGMSPWRRYSPISGDSMHTIVYETEFDSLAAVEASFEKMFADPERQAFMAKADAAVESHVNELYTPMP